MRNFMKKSFVLGTLIVVGAIALSVTVRSADAQVSEMAAQRLQRLTALFELNVKADTYMDLCQDQTKLERNIFYVANYGIVQNELTLALQKTKAEAKFDEAKRVVEQRRRITRRVAERLLQEKGCFSDYAKQSWTHAKKLTRIPTKQMFEYVRVIGY